MEWSKQKYNNMYESWMPWIEDKYLNWYGENKTSYTAKETMKTRVTGDPVTTKLQDGVAEGVGGQFGKGGLLGGVGDAVSTQGVNRMERNEAQHGLERGQNESKTWTQTLSGGYLGSGEQAKGDKK